MKLQNVLSRVTAALMLIGLVGCSDTKLFWDVNEGDQKGAAGQHAATVDSRPPLDVPPSLQGKVEVPHADQIAVQQEMPKRYAPEGVVGKTVALDAKVFDQPVDVVFSSVVCAMTALNYPVQGVDSASGTVTTDWIRKKGKNSLGGLSSAFGGSSILAIRYRFVTRTLRQEISENETSKMMTRLEVHTVAQVYKNNRWEDKILSRRFADEIFSRVAEELGQK